MRNLYFIILISIFIFPFIDSHALESILDNSEKNNADKQRIISAKDAEKILDTLREARELESELQRRYVKLNELGYSEMSPKAIYGIDNRKNYLEVSENVQLAADSTLALIDKKKFSLVQNGDYYNLPSINNINNSGRGLCNDQQAANNKRPEERFYAEANPAFCSSFKVASNIVATAGHCILNDKVCEDTYFVSGFKITTDNKNPEKKIPKDRIYRCVKIIDGEYGGDDKSDWRLVELDRNINDVPQVNFRRKSDIGLKIAQDLTVIGYPMGLPVKIADGAEVAALSDSFFLANLDTYHSSSGSPVFNSDELIKGNLFVEGILVRGEKDFEDLSECFVSKRCPDDAISTKQCKGEAVTYAFKIERAMPKN